MAKKLAFHHVSADEIFRGIAREKNMSLMEFSRYVDKHPGVDYKIDERMARYAKTMNNAVLEGRLRGWLADKYGVPALKVWLDATLPVRAKRIAKRDKKSYHFALEETRQRDESERERYSRIYGIDLNDGSIYNLTIHSDDLTPRKVVKQILEKTGCFFGLS